MPLTRSEIAQTLTELIEDLQKAIPAYKALFSYMKSLVSSLYKDSDHETISTNKNTDDEQSIRKQSLVNPLILIEESKDVIDSYPKSDSMLKPCSHNKRWFRYCDGINNKPKNGFKEKLLKATKFSESYNNLNQVFSKASPKSVKNVTKEQPNLSKNMLQSQEACNKIHKSQSSTKLIMPKLQLEKVSETIDNNEIKGYMEEFMDKYDEFSKSWRNSFDHMRKISQSNEQT